MVGGGMKMQHFEISHKLKIVEMFWIILSLFRLPCKIVKFHRKSWDIFHFFSLSRENLWWHFFCFSFFLCLSLCRFFFTTYSKFTLQWAMSKWKRNKSLVFVSIVVLSKWISVIFSSCFFHHSGAKEFFLLFFVLTVKSETGIIISQRKRLVDFHSRGLKKTVFSHFVCVIINLFEVTVTWS